MRRTCICLFQISPVSDVLDFSCFRKTHLLRTSGGPSGFSLVFPAAWVAPQMLTGRGSLHGSVALHLPRECPPPPAQLAPELCRVRSHVSVHLSREQWNSWNILMLKCSVKRTRENFRFPCLNFSPRGDWGLIIQQENSMHTPASLSVLVSGREM